MNEREWECSFLDGLKDIRVTAEHRKLVLRRADIPGLERLVDGARHNDAIVVFAPIRRQDLVCVCGNAERRPRVPEIPNLRRAVA